MPFNLTERETFLIKRTAYNMARNWRLVERDDLAQELFLFALTHPEMVVRYRDGREGALVVALKRQAHRYATRETAARIGKEVSDDLEPV